MADNSWAERRRRMVKCKTHGLHYDPEMSTGCTRCLREAAKAQPQRSPQLVLILLCLLGMTAILFYIFGPGQSGSAPLIDLGVASAPGATDQKLDPEPFGAQIRELEAALFRTRIEEAEDLLIASSDIAATADDLSSTILALEPTNGLTAADLIARLGQAIPTDQVILADVQKARSQWLGIREQRFEEADWYFEPSSGVDAAEAAIVEYSDVATRLRSSIEDGALEIENLNAAAAEGGADPASGWRTFARDWRQRLDSLENRLPSRPSADADDDLLTAIQELEQALAQARSLAAEPSPPDLSDSRFEDAGNAALRAEQRFDELQL